MPIKYNIIKDKNININDTIVEYDHNSIIVGFAIPRNFRGIDMTNKNLFIKFLDNKYNNGIVKCNRVYPHTKDILNLNEFDGDINNDYFFFQWIIDQTQTKIEGKLKIALEINQVAALKPPTTEQIALMSPVPEVSNARSIVQNEDKIIIRYFNSGGAEELINLTFNNTTYFYCFHSNIRPTNSWVIPPKSGNVFTKYTGLFPIPAEQMNELTIYDSYNLNDIPSYLEQIIKSFGAYDRDYFRWSSLPFEVTINKTIETLENSLDISNFIDLINEQYKYYPNTLTRVNATVGEEASGNIEVDKKTHAMTLNLTLPRGEKGEQGPQGIQGLTGNKGSKGDKGDRGEKGEKGEKGNAFTYNDFTPEQLEGLKGPKGEQGIQGEKGDKGDTGPAGYTLTDEDKTDIANKIDLPIQVIDDQWLDEQGFSHENDTISLEDLVYTGKDWKDTLVAYYILAYPYSLKFPIKNSTEYTEVQLNIGAIIVAGMEDIAYSFVIDSVLGLFTCNFQPNQKFYNSEDLHLVNYHYLDYWTSNYMNHDVFSSTDREAIFKLSQLLGNYDIGKMYCSYGTLDKITFQGRVPPLRDMCGANIIFQSGDTPTQIIIQTPKTYFNRLRFSGDDVEYLETSTGVYHNMFIPKANTLYKLSGLSIGDYYLMDVKAYK